MSARRLVSKTTVSYSMALSAGAVGLLVEWFHVESVRKYHSQYTVDGQGGSGDARAVFL